MFESTAPDARQPSHGCPFGDDKLRDRNRKSQDWSLEMIRLCLICIFVIAASFVSAEERDLLTICDRGTSLELAEYHLAHPDCIAQSNLKKEPLIATAIARRDDTIAIYLLQHHADPYILDSQGRSALDCAVESKRDELIDFVEPYASVLDLPAFAQLNRLDWALRSFAKEKDVKKIKAGIDRLRAHDPALISWDAVAATMERTMGNENRLVECLEQLSFTREPMLKASFLAYAPKLMEKMLTAADRQSMARIAIKYHNRTLFEGVNRAGFFPDGDFREFAGKAFEEGGDQTRFLIIDYGLADRKELDFAVLQYADEGSTELVAKAIAAGGSINTTDEKGMTPIIRTVHGGRYDTLIWLLDAGADVNAKDKSGKSVYDYAKKYSAPQELLDRISTKSKDGARPQKTGQDSPAQINR